MPPNGEDRRQPPRDGKVTAADVDGTATAAAAVTNLPPQGGYMTWENCGSTDIHIVFGATASMAAPTTTTNAGLLKAGAKEDWYMGDQDDFWRAIGSAAGGKLRYWAS